VKQVDGTRKDIKMPPQNFNQIGPIKLPHEWKQGIVKECTHRLFEFPKDRYLVVEVGNIAADKNPLVRIQSACALGDLFESKWCDCAWQWKESKKLMFQEPAGLLIHAFDQHGKGVGLHNHYRVYAEGQKRNQELLTETFDFLGLNYENREYSDIAKILKFYKLSKIRLLTNDPSRIEFFEKNGFEVERMPLQPPVDEHNQAELKIKKEKFGHLLDI